PQSRELVGILALLAAAVTLYLMGPTITRDISAFMHEAFRVDEAAKLNLSSNSAVCIVLIKALKLMVMIGLPICAAGFLVGVLSSYMQVENIFSVEPLSFNLDKINPIKGAQRLLSLRHAKEALRINVKAVVSAGVAY